MATTINITNETWKKLNDLRFSSKETYEDVIKRLIEENKDDIIWEDKE